MFPSRSRLRDHQLLIEGLWSTATNAHGIRKAHLQDKMTSFNAFANGNQTVTTTLLKGTTICSLTDTNRLNVLAGQTKIYDLFGDLDFSPYAVLNLGDQTFTVSAPNFKGKLFKSFDDESLKHQEMAKTGYSFKFLKARWSEDIL